MSEKKSKILFFMMPLYGHITPNLSIIRLLTQHNYEVYCVGSPKHFSVLEACGARCIAYHPAILNSFEMKMTQAEVKQRECVKSHFLALYTRDNLEWNITNGKELYEVACNTLEPHMQEIGPDIILYDSTAIWGLLLGRKYHLPCIDMEAATDMDEITPVYEKFYEEVVLREIMYDMQYGNYQLGVDEEIISTKDYVNHCRRVTRKLYKKSNKLAGLHGDQLLKGDMKFAYVIKEFYEAYASELANVQFCGFDCEMAPIAEKKDGIFVTQGTVTDPYSMRLLVHITNALFSSGEKVTVTTGGDIYYEEVKEKLGELPENIRLSSFVNQLEVLGSHKLMISHGGLSGVREAILSETPMIVYPINYHCFQSALAVEKLGIGIWLKDRQLAQGNAEELLKATQEVLSNPQYVERIKEVKKEFLKEYKQNKVLEYVKQLT